MNLIGAGSGSDFSGGARPAGVTANAMLTWTTGHGSTRFSASIDNQGPEDTTLLSSCRPTYGLDYCAAGALSDGTQVLVEHTTSAPAGAPPTHDDAITIQRPNHVRINVVEWSDGPLTDDQLYTIVSDPRFALQMEGSFAAHADEVIQPFSVAG